MVSRAGKVGGKYSDFWNVRDLISGEIASHEMKEKVDWDLHEDSSEEDEVASQSGEDIHLQPAGSHEILLVNNDLKNEQMDRIRNAKIAEIEKWKE